MMNGEFDYTVVIRTLGNAGDKYRALLESIKQQKLQPIEIIVVLPYGYKVDHEIGNERFIYTEKGMVNQRIVGINSAKTEYILVVDDDVSFNPEFSVDMLKNFSKYDADVVLPSENRIQPHTINSRFKLFIKLLVLNLKYIFIGLRFIHFNKKYVYKIAPTGGNSILYSIKKDKIYLSESGNFQCFFMKTEVAKKVKLEEEYWLKVIKYANNDDQVFFYKSFLKGSKIIFVPKILYSHLDGAIAQSNINIAENLRNKLYGTTFNRIIFWYRFLFAKSHIFKKIYLIVFLTYSIMNTFLLYFTYSVYKRINLKIPFSVFFASIDALNYIKKNNQNLLTDL